VRLLVQVKLRFVAKGSISHIEEEQHTEDVTT
jgi:hypothetical protein